ncbi:MAG TPA: TetR/AcrR family transcriptional regulator [Acidimicrobiales bacterium]|nr:TetR/AcrR family transcriptional regulator [Acidimicrobiales bacterium]
MAPTEIVEAARDCFVSLGVRQVTVEDVARRAHVSRATVYRTVGARPELVRAVMVDEATALFSNVAAAMQPAEEAAELVAAGVAAALATVRDRPVLRRFAGPDLEFVLPVVTLEAAPLVASAVELLLPILEAASERGVVRGVVDLRHLAEELVRYVLGLLHTPSLAAQLNSPDVGGAWAAQLFGPHFSALPDAESARSLAP